MRHICYQNWGDIADAFQTSAIEQVGNFKLLKLLNVFNISDNLT
jgi:hypothetical protein